MKLTPEIQKAIIAASVLHAKQKRKGDGYPFVVHPFSVMVILTSYTDNEDVLMAALLHDVLEDVAGYSKNNLIADFGENVARIVDEVSEDKGAEGEETDPVLTWRERKERYVANLRTDSQEALMVSCADKIHNLMSMMSAYKSQADEVWDNFNAPKDQIMWYYQEVLRVMEDRLASEMVLELRDVYFEAEKLFE
jgi:(p)ppGpp synthase/HD superfamily hydrolase